MKKFDDLERGQEVRGKAAGKMTKVGKAYEVARKIWGEDRRWAAKGWMIWELAGYILGKERDREPLNEMVREEMEKLGIEWN